MKHLKLFGDYQNSEGIFEAYNNIFELDIYGNLNLTEDGLTFLSELPEDTKKLSCGNNFLTSLPELPKGLLSLQCYNNRITSLPKLPEGIQVIDCSINKISILPELPDGLEFLLCYNNPLECIIPKKFINVQNPVWLNEYYFPYINSYKGQKNILTKQPHMFNELITQAKTMLPEIKKEFSHLFTGSDLNLL